MTTEESTLSWVAMLRRRYLCAIPDNCEIAVSSLLRPMLLGEESDCDGMLYKFADPDTEDIAGDCVGIRAELVSVLLWVCCLSADELRLSLSLGSVKVRSKGVDSKLNLFGSVLRYESACSMTFGDEPEISPGADMLLFSKRELAGGCCLRGFWLLAGI